MSKIVTAIFDTRGASEFALRNLDRTGFTKNQVTMLISEETRRHFGIAKGSGLVGALYQALASAGTLMIPGLNLVASGTIIGSLAALGTSAASGGLSGALVGIGIPAYEAQLYEEKIRKGAILIAVEAAEDARADRVRSILEDANTLNITSIAA